MRESRSARQQPDWLSLWRERGDNPLLKYWAISDARSESTDIARRVQRGWLIVGGLASLLCTFLIIAFTLEAQKAGNGPTAQLFRMNSLAASYRLFVDCLAISGSVWFVSRFGSTFYTALSFLQSEGSGGARQLFEDLLSSSPLAARETIFAFMVRALRSCTLPLVLLSLSTAMLCIPLGAMTSIANDIYAGAGSSSLEAWQIALRFLIIFASSLLFGWISLLFHVLLSLALGLSNTGRLMPTVGAIVAALMQLLSIGLPELITGVQLAGSLTEQDAALLNMLAVSSCTGFVGGVILLVFASSWRSLRSVLAYAFSALIMAVTILSIEVVSFDTDLLSSFTDYAGATGYATRWLSVYSAATALYSAPVEMLILLIAKTGFLTLCYFLAWKAIDGRRLGEVAS